MKTQLSRLEYYENYEGVLLRKSQLWLQHVIDNVKCFGVESLTSFNLYLYWKSYYILQKNPSKFYWNPIPQKIHFILKENVNFQHFDSSRICAYQYEKIIQIRDEVLIIAIFII